MSGSPPLKQGARTERGSPPAPTGFGLMLAGLLLTTAVRLLLGLIGH